VTFFEPATNATLPCLSESRALPKFPDTTSLPARTKAGPHENGVATRRSRSAAGSGRNAQTAESLEFHALLPVQGRFPLQDRAGRSCSLSTRCERGGKYYAKCDTSN